MDITFQFNGPEAAAKYQAVGGEIVAAIGRSLTEQAIYLQSYIVGQKLQGQVLHHRTGKLANSIRAFPAEPAGAGLASRVEGAGGPAWYGRIHEYGGVFSATRRRKLLEANSGSMRGATYEIHFPERSFMRSSLTENRTRILEAVRASIAGVLAGIE